MLKFWKVIQDCMKWKNIEGFGLWGQIRVLFLVLLVVISLAGSFIYLVDAYFQGKDLQIYLFVFVLLLVMSVGLILFVYYHQKQLNWIVEERKKLDSVLYEVAESIRLSTILLIPFMPSTCQKIMVQLGITKSTDDVRIDKDGAWGSFEGSTKIGEREILFPRIEDK